MSIRSKFAIQVILALGAAWALKYLLGTGDFFIPGVAGFFELGIWYVPIAAFTIIPLAFFSCSVFPCAVMYRNPP